MRMSDWSSDVCSSDLPFGDADGTILMEGCMVAEAGEKELERLGFDDRFIGDVIDHQMREIGLRRDGAERREFGHGEAHQIALAGARVGHIIEPGRLGRGGHRSEEHTSELQSLMRISYAVFCLKKKNNH